MVKGVQFGPTSPSQDKEVGADRLEDGGKSMPNSESTHYNRSGGRSQMGGWHIPTGKPQVSPYIAGSERSRFT